MADRDLIHAELIEIEALLADAELKEEDRHASTGRSKRSGMCSTPTHGTRASQTVSGSATALTWRGVVQDQLTASN